MAANRSWHSSTELVLSLNTARWTPWTVLAARALLFFGCTQASFFVRLLHHYGCNTKLVYATDPCSHPEACKMHRSKSILALSLYISSIESRG